METKKLYTILKNDYHLDYIIKTLLGVDELHPFLIHTPERDIIGFRVDGREVKLYIKSLKDEVILIDEGTDTISETYINVYNNQTETIIIKRDDKNLRRIKVERFFEIEDKTVSYIEEDHRTYSHDKVREIYNLPDADIEFTRMRILLNTFKHIDEDALVEGIEEDRHDSLVIYDNRYMKLSDEDVFVKINDQIFKFKYEDNYLDFIIPDNAKELKKVLS